TRPAGRKQVAAWSVPPRERVPVRLRRPWSGGEPGGPHAARELLTKREGGSLDEPELAAEDVQYGVRGQQGPVPVAGASAPLGPDRWQPLGAPAVVDDELVLA